MFDDIFQDRNEICLRFNFTSIIIKNPKLKKKDQQIIIVSK